NAVYLASRGFEVTGVDLAPLAVDAAGKRARSSGVKVRFLAADVLNLPDLGPPFDFIFDRGCFHSVRQADEAGIIRVFNRHLSDRGRLLVLTGNASEENPPEEGPPRVTEQEMRKAFESFDVLHLRPFLFDKIVGRDYRPLAWSMLAKKK